MKIIKNSTICVAASLVATLMSSPVSAKMPSALAQEASNKHFKMLRKDKPGHYSRCESTPTRVGKENYQKNHLSLSGLEGVYIDVDGLLKSAKRRKVKMADKLEEEISQRLAKGGLKLLTKKQMERTHGQPEMNLYMSFPPHLNPSKKGEVSAPYRPDCCRMSIWSSFAQGAQILRDPETNYKLSTWGTGHDTNDCSNPSAWMSQVILKSVDSFVKEKLKGDRDYAKWLKARDKVQADKQVSKVSKRQVTKEPKISQPTPKPRKKLAILKPAPKPQKVASNRSAITKCGEVKNYIDIFAENKTRIDSSRQFVFNQMASNISNCPMYNYIIETHSDSRSSHAYNDRLSALRAASIQGYLLAKNVPQSRFVVQAFGERSPVSRGNSSLDYAANRRVVVRPIKLTE